MAYKVQTYDYISTVPTNYYPVVYRNSEFIKTTNETLQIIRFSTHIQIFRSTTGYSWTLQYTASGTVDVLPHATLRYHTDGYVYFNYTLIDVPYLYTTYIVKSNDGFATSTLVSSVSIGSLYTRGDLIYYKDKWYCSLNHRSRAYSGDRFEENIGFLDMTTPGTALINPIAYTDDIWHPLDLLNIVEYNGNLYTCYVRRGLGTIYICKFDGTTTIELTSSNLFCAIDVTVSSMILKGSKIYIVTKFGADVGTYIVDLEDPDYKLIKIELTNTIANRYTVFTETNDNRIGNYIGIGYSGVGDASYITLYKLFKNGALAKIFEEISSNTPFQTIAWGYDDYMLLSHDLFKKCIHTGQITLFDSANTTYNTFSPINVKRSHKQFIGSQIAFDIDLDDDFEMFKGQYLEIYDSTDQLQIAGGYEILKTVTIEKHYFIQSWVQNDFETIIEVNWVNLKSHEMLNDLINTKCNHINGTIADDSYVDWSYTAKKAIKYIINDIMTKELHLFIVDRDHDATFISSPLAGAADETLDYDNIGSLKKELKSYPLSKIIGNGQTKNGSFITKNWINDDTDFTKTSILVVEYPNFTDGNLLQNMVDQLGEQYRNQQTILNVVAYDINYLNYGDICQISYALKEIGTNTPTYEKFMVIDYAENDYGETRLKLTNTFIFQSNAIGNVQSPKIKLEKLQENVVITNKSINQNDGSGISPSRVQVDSDDEYGKGIWDGIVDWGTTGEIDWTISSRPSAACTFNIVDFDEHNNCVKFVKPITGWMHCWKAVSGQYTSCWMNADDTADTVYWQMHTADDDVAFGFSGGYFWGHSGGELFRILAPIDATWYHMAMYLDATNDKIYFYVDGNLIWTDTTRTIGVVESVYFIYANPSTGTAYYDAFSSGDTEAAMWSNFGAGHLQAESAYIKQLQYDYSNHEWQYPNISAWHYLYGSFGGTAGSWNTLDISAYLPSTDAYDVQLTFNFVSTVAGRYFQVRPGDHTGTFAVGCIVQVANQAQFVNVQTKTNKSGEIEYLFSVIPASGQIYMSVLAYRLRADKND